jgi:hypothetical protein
MRFLSLFLMAMVAAAVLSGACEGACPKLRYVDNVEWLGTGDLGMDMSMPVTSAPAAKASETGMAEDNDSQNATRDETVEAPEDLDPAEDEAAGSGGYDRIRLILVGDVTGRVDLTLFRSAEVVFGAGNLTAGGAKTRVGVSGSASQEALILRLVPEDGSRLYLLDLKEEKGSIRGGYEALDPSGRLLTGRAESSPYS